MKSLENKECLGSEACYHPQDLLKDYNIPLVDSCNNYKPVLDIY